MAREQDGTRETPGRNHNPKVLAYFKDAGHPEIVDDETAWCAAFVGAMLERTNYRSTRSLMARSYLTWGKPSTLKIGAIAVFKRGSNPIFGHVGFVVGWNATHIYVLGGNQSNAVNITKMKRSDLLPNGLRWPTTLRNSRTVQGGGTALTGTGLTQVADQIPATEAQPLTDAGNSLVSLGAIKWWLGAIGAVLIVAGVAWMLYARWDDYHNKGR